MDGSHLQRLAYFLISAGIVLAGMMLAETLTIPLAWALLFAFILLPLCRRFERKLSRPVSALLATVVLVIFAGLLLSYLTYEAISILSQESMLYERVASGIRQLVATLQEIGLPIDPQTSRVIDADTLGKLLNLLAVPLSNVGNNLVLLMLIPMYLFFILNYRSLVRRFVEARFSGEPLEKTRTFFNLSQTSINNYLYGTLLLTGVSAVMTFAILKLFGVSYALFFSIFLSILNLIPYVGNLLGFLVILLFVWVTKDSVASVLLVGGSLYLANLIQENLLRPKLIGDKMQMNAMVVFTAVIVGSMIWGFSGMVLFIPFLGIVKALLDSHPEWKAYSIFFESGDKPKKRKA